MVEQLTWKLPLLPGSLTTLYKRHSEERTKPTVSEYVQILKLILEGLSTTYVIFDAIDECTYENNLCQNLLDVIFGLQRDCQLQLFVTSRFIPEIMRRFEGTNSVEIRASSQDVQRYLEENVKNLAACVQEDVALRTDICTTIAESIEGMFLLAKLHLDSLRNERRPKQIRSVLSSLKSRDPLNNVKALDLAYEKAIETVNGQHPNDAGLAKQILSWIVYAKRPLSITELQHALAVQDDANFDAVDLLNPQDILSVCAGLLTVDENTRIVRFLHYTAQEYFEKMPQIWLQDAQAAIALACISYLCKDAFATGVCDSDAAFEKRLRDFPLLDFASRYWGDYASKVTAAELQLRAMDFLRRSQNVACSIQVLRCSRHQSHEYSQKFALHSSGLHLAAHFGLKLLVTSIVENTDTVTDLRNSYGETPLAWAAKSGQESVVKLLVQRNDVDADSRNKYGQTPLAMAAEAGYMQVVKLLAERDDVEADSQSTNGWTPLLWAAINGHELMVNLLIKRDDVKAESRDSFYGQTPLSWAARNGHESVVKLLADHHDTEVDSRDSASQTPLLWAARNGHESIVKFFIGRKDVDVNSWDCVYGHTPLFWAARNGHELVLQTLIQRDDVEVDTADSWGRTPLSRAAEQGRELIVQCLIARADVDINSKDEYSQTPLGWAAENGHDSVVKLLVNRDDIEVDSKNYKGQTPLWQATRNGHVRTNDVILSDRDEGGEEDLSRNAVKISSLILFQKSFSDHESKQLAEASHGQIKALYLRNGEYLLWPAFKNPLLSIFLTMKMFFISILSLVISLLAFSAVAQNAPPYDGKYYDVWYPIGSNTTPFATTQNRLFKINGKAQYLTGAVKLKSFIYEISKSFIQSGLRQLDYVVHAAEQRNLFLVLPLVDYNSGVGGIDLYQQVFGCNETLWYTDITCQNAYKSYARTIINRYKSSPAVFAWEIMNEPRCHLANHSGCNTTIVTNWASQFSAWVKSLDPHHMVTLGEEGWFTPKDGYGDGTYAYQGTEGMDFVNNLGISTLDYATVHCYPISYGYTTKNGYGPAWGSTWITQHDQAGAKAGKPVAVEEYGEDAAYTGVAGWQQTILNNTKVALDIIWDFSAHTQEIGPCNTSCPVYQDDLSLFYNTTTYNQYIIAHAQAMAKKAVS
ncbi:hypothetical protein FH972_026890 [Carpinus fangiana]|uniref:Uncharacterized protein n=1 Tax=Carpinus fangiana TaxID=176857 RepID=A0A5N6L5P9_9ROSI|nr:hypothetical protein FH972_026890 [Carpinus fangiana]